MQKYRFIVLLVLLLFFEKNSALVTIDRSDEVKYTVLLDDSRPTILPEGVVVPMKSPLTQKNYLCVIPPEPSSADNEDPNSVEIPDLDQLLSPLTSTCLYRLSGWWTYEFCHTKHIRQFHQERDLPIRPQDEFFLGRYAASIAGEIKSDPEQSYYAYRYTDGTVCDLNGQKRSTEVRFFCSGEKSASALMDVKEPSSCNYVLAVNTPLICKHPSFKTKKETTMTIQCFAENGVPDGTEEHASEQPKQGKANPALKEDLFKFDDNEEDDDFDTGMEVQFVDIEELLEGGNLKLAEVFEEALKNAKRDGAEYTVQIQLDKDGKEVKDSRIEKKDKQQQPEDPKKKKSI